jgi:hypothetical protein
VYMKVMGIVQLSKLGGFALTVGSPVWVDNTGKACSSGAATKVKVVGQCLGDVTTAAILVDVLLLPTTTVP